MRRIVFVFALLVFGTPTESVHGQAAPEAALLAKGTTVTLKLPADLGSLKSGFATVYGVVKVEPHGDVVIVEGHTDWETMAFPSFAEYQVEKIDRKKDATEVDLREAPPGRARVRMVFPANIATDDLARGFAKLVIAGPSKSLAVEEYRNAVYQRMAKQFFTGTPMEKLPENRQLSLARFAHITATGTRLGAETYKEKTYFVVNLGLDSNQYNDLKLSQGALVAHVVNEKLLHILKDFAAQVKDVPELQGLKLEIIVPHKSFLEEYAKPKLSRLQVFAQSDLITKFANADITNQQFIDGCVVIMDDNRVQVALSGL
jgi:hypothetical protein